MCTIIKKSQRSHPKTAKEDFIVYKNGYYYKPEFSSVFVGFKYISGQVYKTNFTYANEYLAAYDYIEGTYREELFEKGVSPVAVQDGFHSLKTCDTFRLKVNYSENKYRAEFIIPKGAKYYENPMGNIVSDTIVFNKIILE